MNGFSLHAAVRYGADERKAVEQLCRYITHPALANERVQCNAAGQVVLRLKTPWRDGATRRVMSALEFMHFLAPLGHWCYAHALSLACRLLAGERQLSCAESRDL